MARPIKTGLDYFPMDVNIDENLELLEAEHGLIGFAIIIKLWQKIYANGYFIEWNDDNILLFSKRINTELTIINDVINRCFLRNLFDEKLYKKYKILTSSGIQKRYFTACSQSKRKQISIISEYCLVNSEFNQVITEFIKINNELSTQSKVKESKVKESKIEYSIFYDNEILENKKEAFIDKYELIIKFIYGRLNNTIELKPLLKLDDQLTYKEFVNLYAKCNEKNIKLSDIFLEMYNWKLLKNKKTIYRTALTFIGNVK